MTIRDALETAARGLDSLIDAELATLAASGADAAAIANTRARLADQRTAILAELWTRLERDGPPAADA